MQAGPTQYCNLEFTDCRNDAAAPVELPVPPGTALQVEVPDEIAETPWQVVFSYRDAAGAQADGRSPVFAADERRDYALQLPTPTDRLLTAQVQQYGPPPQANPDTGEIEFPIRASWVLTAAPVTDCAASAATARTPAPKCSRAPPEQRCGSEVAQEADSHGQAAAQSVSRPGRGRRRGPPRRRAWPCAGPGSGRGAGPAAPCCPAA